jgi:hypothetical protein
MKRSDSSNGRKRDWIAQVSGLPIDFAFSPGRLLIQTHPAPRGDLVRAFLHVMADKPSYTHTRFPKGHPDQDPDEFCNGVRQAMKWRKLLSYCTEKVTHPEVCGMTSQRTFPV